VVPAGKRADTRWFRGDAERLKKVSEKVCNKRAGIDEQSAQLAVNRAWHRQRAASFATHRDPCEFFRQGHTAEVHVTRLIDLEENKSGSAIDHRLVTQQSLQPKNAIHVSLSGAGAR
jgi:hypothetical protein